MHSIASRVRVCIAVAGLLSTAARSMHAQRETERCQRAKTALSTQELNVEAMDEASRCPESGPLALAETWERASAKSAVQRAALVEATGYLRDGRLFDAVVNVALDGSRSAPDRVAALQSLMRYYDPGYAPSFEALTSHSGERSVALRIDGPTPTLGSVPLSASTRTRIGEVLAQLMSPRQNSTVRTATGVLRQRLAYDDPAHTPVADGAISLIAGCSDRVTLRSTADVDLEINLEVAGTSFSRKYSIRAGTTAKPTDRLLGLPRGTVIATYGGRELARLSVRNAPCPPGMVR